jgi:Ca-activated chloride channel homolog
VSSARRFAPLVLALLVAALSLAIAQLPRTLSLSLFGARFGLLDTRGLHALLLLPLIAWIPSWSYAELPRTRRVGSLALRMLGVGALSLALAQPVSYRASGHTSTVFALDVSDSIASEAIERAQRYVEQAVRLRDDHHVSALRFAEHSEPIATTDHVLAPRFERGSASDLEAALSFALGQLEPAAVGQIVLFSDGRQTAGDLERAVEQLAGRGVRLLVQSEPTTMIGELGIADLSLPAEVDVGQPFSIEAHVEASVPVQAHVRLTRVGDGQLVEPERTLLLPAGESTLRFRARGDRPGRQVYRLTLATDQPDRFRENNQFERSVRVRGAPRVLYVEREREQAYAFSELLERAGFAVEVRSPSAAPRTAGELDDVRFYLLSDVARSELAPAALSTIERYVRDGGGFMMTGGPRGFGAGGYQGSLLEPILPVALSSSLQREEPTLALVLAIDKSGSMAGEKLERAKEAALATAELLPSDAYLGVIGFDAEPLWVTRLSVGGRAASMERAISGLHASGGTALFPALDLAYGGLLGLRAKVKHVVVLTDGQAEDEQLAPLVRTLRADGMTVSAIGVGDDVNRGLLSELASLGGGRAYFTRDPARVPRLFTEEASIVARPPTLERRVTARLVSTAEFMKGIAIEQAPPLRGYVSTHARGAPAQLVLSTSTGEPLLARMRVGLGWSLAFTSDVKPRWSSDWFGWPAHSQLFAQLVREHKRQDAEQASALSVRFEQDHLIASLDAFDARDRFLSDYVGELRVTSPAATSERAPFVAVAPGRYEARVPASELGSYDVEARLSHARLPPVTARVGAALPFPAEYRPPFAPDRELLERLAARTGGGRLPPPAQLFSAGGRSIERPVERWPPLVWLALVLFVADVALRRLPRLRLGARTGT